jgi:hypothetical protein
MRWALAILVEAVLVVIPIVLLTQFWVGEISQYL